MKNTLRILLAVFFYCLTKAALSQDVIVKTDNTTILSKVLEINSNEIKYKKWSNQEGPTYSISRSEVLSINYQNGDVDRFNDSATTQPVPQAVPQPTPQPTVAKPQVQTPLPQPQRTEPAKPISSFGRGRVQFSLNGGVALPMGKFGTTAETHYSLVDFCAPFQLFAENEGVSNQVGLGAAKTGFIGSMRLHIPVYESGKNIIGIPFKINVLHNGITDSEKQPFKTVLEPAISATLNEGYGVYAFDFKVTEFPRYWNFSIMSGLDYSYYINKSFALFAEGSIGLNFNHVTSTQMQNRLGGTFIPQYNVYSMNEFNFNYITKANFAYEIGGGFLLWDHFSVGVFYLGNSPVQLSFDIDAANISGGDIVRAQKLQVSALSIQLGVHF